MKVHLIPPRIGRAVRLGSALLGVAVAGLFAGGEARGQLIHEGEAFQIVDAAQVPTVASPAESSMMTASPVPPGMPTFARRGASCGGACGGGAGFAGAYGTGSFGAGYGAAACPTCDPFWYGMVEGLYLRRLGDEDFTLARDFALDEFDYEWTPRLTVGYVPDCVHGIEASFTGQMEWDMGLGVFSGTDSLQTLLSPAPPLLLTDLDTFNNARAQSQSYEAEFWSVEVNRTFHGWGVSKLLYGFRYIDYSEHYNYLSFDATDGSGLLRSETENALIGGQVGLDLLYPVARYVSVDFRGRAGAYLNIADSEVDVFNDGVRVIGFRPEEEELAGMFELGSGLRWQLGEILAIRGGAELWYLSGVANATDQIRARVTRDMGRKLDVDDDVLVLGLTCGAELKW